MKVFIVEMYGNTCGIYSTRKLANAARKRCCKSDWDPKDKDWPFREFMENYSSIECVTLDKDFT